MPGPPGLPENSIEIGLHGLSCIYILSFIDLKDYCDIVLFFENRFVLVTAYLCERFNNIEFFSTSIKFYFDTITIKEEDSDKIEI